MLKIMDPVCKILFIVNMLEKQDEAEIHGKEQVPKIVLLLVTAVFLFFPLYSITGKLQKSIGNQPKLIFGISIAMVVMTVLLVAPVWFTRRTRKAPN